MYMMRTISVRIFLKQLAGTLYAVRYGKYHPLGYVLGQILPFMERQTESSVCYKCTSYTCGINHLSRIDTVGNNNPMSHSVKFTQIKNPGHPWLNRVCDFQYYHQSLSYGNHQHWRVILLWQCFCILCPWVLLCGCPELYSEEYSPQISLHQETNKY